MILSPHVNISYSQAYADSNDGICRAFDNEANGAVRGEGGGLILLCPLSKAQELGLTIYALLQGSAVNQDGLTNGLASPSPAGQESVLVSAYKDAGIDPNLSLIHI